MDRFNKIKYAVAAAGVMASVAFYVMETGDTGAGGHIAVFEDTGTGDAGSDESEVLTDNLTDEYGLTAYGQEQEEDGSGTETGFTDEQKAAIEEIVRTAVREEIYAVCEEGYLEAALKEASVLAAEEAEARKNMINLNTAGIEELTSLTGIGEKRAEDIISYREAAGGFGSIEEVMNVSGIKQSVFDKIKDKIYV